MKLIYRGIAHQLDSSTVFSTVVGGKGQFLGAQYQIAVTQCDRPKAGIAYRFRGIPYQS